MEGNTQQPLPFNGGPSDVLLDQVGPTPMECQVVQQPIEECRLADTNVPGHKNMLHSGQIEIVEPLYRDQETFYPDVTFNHQAIQDAIQGKFYEIKKSDKRNTIARIHKDIRFYYNSLNICLGKQGSGKTTFLMRELIKLSTLPDCGKYECILYVTPSEVTDETLLSLVRLIRNIPVKACSFSDSIDLLTAYFENRENNEKHIFVILEDATFLLIKDNNAWCYWMTRLRHLRMTVWINLHVWRSITTQIKSQITSIFVGQGYTPQQMQVIYRQSCVTNLTSCQFIWYYQQLQRYHFMEINNIEGFARSCN